MNDLQPASLAVLLAALCISVGNLVVAYGRTRVKKSGVDVQALEVAIKLAEKAPWLEQQLREMLSQLSLAQADAVEQRHKIEELNEVIALQAEEIRHLKRDNHTMAAQLAEFHTSLQAFKSGTR